LKKAGEGFLPVDKPPGVTSFAAVAAVRRRLGGVKAGHAGTLDPAASGLLVVALGRATRLLPFVPLEPKHYLFGISFGTQTDTLDADGSVVKSGGSVPSSGALKAALLRFTGTLSQVPPEFSAVKIGGVRAYRLAREGRRVELAPRRIAIVSLTLLRYDETAGRAECEVICSGGTYVRSLARDIAVSLGTCGYASSVRRIAAGDFHVERALAFSELQRAAEQIVSVNEVLRGLPRIVVNAVQKRKLVQGIDIAGVDVSSPENAKPDSAAFAFDHDNNLVAVLKERDDGRFHPVTVLLS
jgi:tRNA pseudouridine55 synthase